MDGALHFDIRKVCAYHAIHDTPYVGDGVLVMNGYIELIADKGFGTLAAEEVFGSYSFT